MINEYSIKVLFGNITKILSESMNLDARYHVEKGLEPKIRTFDEGAHVTDCAYVSKNSDTQKNEVWISVAFCQFFWLICDVVLKYADIAIVREECLKTNRNLRDYYEEALHFKYLLERKKRFLLQFQSDIVPKTIMTI